jgi:hypothetical protein
LGFFGVLVGVPREAVEEEGHLVFLFVCLGEFNGCYSPVVLLRRPDGQGRGVCSKDNRCWRGGLLKGQPLLARRFTQRTTVAGEGFAQRTTVTGEEVYSKDNRCWRGVCSKDNRWGGVLHYDD